MSLSATCEFNLPPSPPDTMTPSLALLISGPRVMTTQNTHPRFHSSRLLSSPLSWPLTTMTPCTACIITATRTPDHAYTCNRRLAHIITYHVPVMRDIKLVLTTTTIQYIQ